MTPTQKKSLVDFVFPAVLLLGLGGFFLGFSGGVDDAHISYWSAWTLSHEAQLLNYNFERIEQSSSLGQVLLLAAMHTITAIPMVTLAHLSSLFAALMTLLLTARVATRFGAANGEHAMGLLASLLLASSPFFLYWSYAGMEAPWLALLFLSLVVVTAEFLQHGKSQFALVTVSMATQLMRPEAPVVLCVFGAVLLLVAIFFQRHSLWTWRRALLFLSVQVFAAVILLSWRMHYFHAWMPQPVNAKIGSALLPQVLAGLAYLRLTVLDGFLVMPTLLVIAGGVYGLARHRNAAWQLSWLLVLIYSAFVVASGGDWMAAGRFWVPVVPLLTILLAQAVQDFVQRNAFRIAVASIIMICNVVYVWRGTTVDFNSVPLWSTSQLQANDGGSDYSFFEKHARENQQSMPLLTYVKPLLSQLASARQQQQLPVQIMAGQMGMVPYYLAQTFPRQLRFTDRNGITETLLTDCPVARGLPRTRNGIGTGYAWVLEHRTPLAAECGFVMPDLVFDIDTGWNKRNIQALENAGYVFIYRQRDRQPDNSRLLPLRPIYAALFVAVSPEAWRLMGSPSPVVREF